jgi:hypothetical protein
MYKNSKILKNPGFSPRVNIFQQKVSLLPTCGVKIILIYSLFAE